MNTESESLPRPGWTYSDQRWQGFLSPIDVTIDLGSVQDVHYVGGTFMQLIGPGVFMPEKVDTICNEKARYVRYHAFRSPMRGFIFLDEIVVN